MKLTTTELRWLRHASTCGPEGFTSKLINSLVRLERLGLLERDLVTSQARTRWRITARGKRVPLGIGKPKKCQSE